MEIKIRILYIDDNFQDRRLIKDILLKEHGEFEIVEIDSREKFETYTLEGNIDLVLTDFDIFGFDGFQIISDIKAKHPLPVIIVTSKGSEELAVKAMKMGADDYITKSAKSIEHLGAAIQSVLEIGKIRLEHNKIHTTLNESAGLFLTAFEDAAIGICLVSLDGKFISVNKAFCNIIGYSKEEIEQFTINNFTHNDDKKISEFYFNQLISGETDIVIYEKRYIHKLGHTLWVNVSIRTVHKPKVKSQYFISYIQDITERKRTEEALKKTVSEMQMLFKNMLNAFVIWESVFDENGKYVSFRFGFFNDSYAKIAKVKQEEVLGKDVFEVWPTTEPRWVEIYGEVAVTGIPKTFKMFHDPTNGWYHCNAYRPTDSPAQVCVIFEDITERQQAEEALRLSEEKFRAIFENNSSAIAIINPDTTIQLVNEAYCRMAGYTKQEIIGGSWTKQIVPEDLERLMEYNRLRFINPKDAPAKYEFKFYKKDGEIRNAFMFVSYMQSSQQIITSLLDITELRRSEETIRHERIMLRTLIDSLPDTIYVKDAAARKLIANSADMRAMGCTSEADIIGKTDLEIYKNDAGVRGYAEDMSVLQTGKPLVNQEESFSDAEGKQHWRLTSKIPLYNEQNQIIGLVGFGYDITERKQSEELLLREQYLMHSLMDNIPDAIYFKDLNSRFLRINTAMANLFGLDDPKKAVGKTDYDFFKTEHSQQTYIDEQEIIRTGKPIIGKEEMETWFDRPPTWVLSTKMPLIDAKGEIIGTFGISRNITERKLAEEELVKAKEKAEESDRLKTAFLHNISHEIRTPMNAIVGFSDYLNYPGLSSEKREYYTEIIIKSSNQLLSIITDIVNIATIEAGQEKVFEKEINLNSLIKLLYDQFLIKAQKQHIYLSYKTTLPDSDSDIITDETKLTEILSNLLGNAIKFTKDGYIDFGYSIKNSFIEFYVKDTGIGIPTEMHEEIFKRFRQVEISANRQFGGSGLGLSISKSYVEMLGGNIWLDSQPGKGSMFAFTIAYKKARPESTTDEQQTFNDSNLHLIKNQTILVAEDEDYNFILLEELLSFIEVKVLRASNGKDAVEMCETNPQIDLVLMDIKMPGMDGYEAIRLIRKIRPDLPIIAQTAYSVNADKDRAFACGCTDFISKPYKQDVLLSKIKELMVHKTYNE